MISRRRKNNSQSRAVQPKGRAGDARRSRSQPAMGLREEIPRFLGNEGLNKVERARERPFYDWYTLARSLASARSGSRLTLALSRPKHHPSRGYSTHLANHFSGVVLFVVAGDAGDTEDPGEIEPMPCLRDSRPERDKARWRTRKCYGKCWGNDLSEIWHGFLGIRILRFHFLHKYLHIYFSWLF